MPDSQSTAALASRPSAPLAMPTQDLAKPSSAPPQPVPTRTRVVRAIVVLGTVAMTLAFSLQLYAIVSFVRLDPLLAVFLILASAAFSWVAYGTMLMATGFVLLLTGRQPVSIELQPPAPSNSRTALLFPVYHEPPSGIAGAIEALASDLSALGRVAQFDVFVISDTRDVELARAEERMFAALAGRLQATVAVSYRRRDENRAKKAGNIREWIERRGAAYDYFVVLDADSLMTGDLLARLVRTMDADPRLGLVQTVPRLLDGTTRFQHLQQFAGSVYGPVAAAGLAAFNGRDGNYWGHNAIIRTTAFAAAAGLPELPGKAPFGGHIQSHDFVEACLLLRAGWAVTMVPEAKGSYEGSPPGLIEYAARERRWAQGNMQHLSVLRRGRLTAMGRVHLSLGAASYLASALWLFMVVLGAGIAVAGDPAIPRYFGSEPQLFPMWPEIDPDAALRLVAATLAVVLAPKVMGLIWRLRTEPELGRWRSVRGVLAETALSTLIAPVLMAVHTRAVIEIVTGRDSGWMVQRRDGACISLRDALVFNWLHILLGIGLATACSLVSIDLLLWASPVCLGLILSAPMTWWTSRPAGPALRHVLATAEDLSPPPLLVRARQMARALSRR